MKQSAFKFGGKPRTPRYKPAARNVEWAEVTIADPVRYPGLSQTIALMALHKAGKPHREKGCPLCCEERMEIAS